jgi:hypothetical protein
MKFPFANVKTNALLCAPKKTGRVVMVRECVGTTRLEKMVLEFFVTNALVRGLKILKILVIGR